MIPKCGLHLAEGVVLRKQNKDGTTSSIAAAGGKDQCIWFVNRDEVGRWYGAVLFHADLGAETKMDIADVVLGPVESENAAIGLVADQLAIYVAAAIGGATAWYEAEPDLAGSGLSKDLLDQARDRTFTDLFKRAFDEQRDSDDDPDAGWPPG